MHLLVRANLHIVKNSCADGHVIPSTVVIYIGGKTCSIGFFSCPAGLVGKLCYLNRIKLFFLLKIMGWVNLLVIPLATFFFNCSWAMIMFCKTKTRIFNDKHVSQLQLKYTFISLEFSITVNPLHFPLSNCAFFSTHVCVLISSFIYFIF